MLQGSHRKQEVFRPPSWLMAQEVPVPPFWLLDTWLFASPGCCYWVSAIKIWIYPCGFPEMLQGGHRKQEVFRPPSWLMAQEVPVPPFWLLDT